MPTYTMPLNIILCLAAFWTGVIQGYMTGSWLVAAAWVTASFVLLTSERLIPARQADETQD